jgi:uncharacterized protein (DUF58 family)
LAPLATDEPLLAGEELRQLERLSVVDLGTLLAGLVGQRVGPSGARGLEFADYRPYTPGDELRRVDWNIYARLGEAFVKTAPSEAHVGISLLIDGSRSMDTSDPGRPSKFRYGQRLAAMIGAVALLSSDVAEVHLLADGESWDGGALSAPRSVIPLVEQLVALRRGVRTDLAGSVGAYRSKRTDAEAAVLITDALVDPENLRETLEELSASAATATLVHVIDERERTIGLRGPIELRDRETGERMLVDVTAAVGDQYAARFDALVERVGQEAAACGVSYVRAVTSVSPLDLLFRAATRGEIMTLS